jgi:hypothetical protein
LRKEIYFLGVSFAAAFFAFIAFALCFTTACFAFAVDSVLAPDWGASAAVADRDTVAKAATMSADRSLFMAHPFIWIYTSDNSSPTEKISNRQWMNEQLPCQLFAGM